MSDRSTIHSFVRLFNLNQRAQAGLLAIEEHYRPYYGKTSAGVPELEDNICECCLPRLIRYKPWFPTTYSSPNLCKTNKL